MMRLMIGIVVMGSLLLIVIVSPQFGQWYWKTIKSEHFLHRDGAKMRSLMGANEYVEGHWDGEGERLVVWLWGVGNW